MKIIVMPYMRMVLLALVTYLDFHGDPAEAGLEAGLAEAFDALLNIVKMREKSPASREPCYLMLWRNGGIFWNIGPGASLITILSHTCLPSSHSPVLTLTAAAGQPSRWLPLGCRREREREHPSGFKTDIGKSRRKQSFESQVLKPLKPEVLRFEY